MPKGVRRNPFQTLLTTAEKQLQASRERLAAAEQDADCIHQKKIRASRVEHDEWSKMVKQLRQSLTLPQLAPLPVTTQQSNNVAADKPVVQQRLQRATHPEIVGDEPTRSQQAHTEFIKTKSVPHIVKDESVPTYDEQGPVAIVREDAGERAAARRQSKRQPQSAFDKCPGLPTIKCSNSKPKESEFCGRCAVLKNVRTTPKELATPFNRQ